MKLIKDLKVKKSKGSINEACKVVLNEFFNLVEDVNENYAHLFVINILDIHDNLPITFKQQLELFVRRDLSEVDKLLEHYNSFEFIVINILNEKLKVEIPDDFTLMRKELTHSR